MKNYLKIFKMFLTGTRGTRRPRGEKKTPEEKKAKQEKKEAIKAPPPVQVFEEETRMSADIKPPIPDRVTGSSHIQIKKVYLY